MYLSCYLEGLALKLNGKDSLESETLSSRYSKTVINGLVLLKSEFEQVHKVEWPVS